MVALCTSSKAVKAVVSAFVLLVFVACNISIDAFITTAFSGVRFQPKGPKLTARLAVTGVNHDSINSHIGGRRDTIKKLAVVLGILTVTDSAYALDMDAFIKSEVSVNIISIKFFCYLQVTQRDETFAQRVYSNIAPSLLPNYITTRLKRIAKIATQKLTQNVNLPCLRTKRFANMDNQELLVAKHANGLKKKVVIYLSRRKRNL
jgi:hypothetical protein